MYLASEYNTKPRKILMHSPRMIDSIRSINPLSIAANNFISAPHYEKLVNEFESLTTKIKSYGVEVVDLADLTDEAGRQALSRNPNSMFVRDSAITLPWDGQIAILSNMTLIGREAEPEIMKTALQKLGVKKFFQPQSHIKIEGGDVIALCLGGKRVLFVGIGGRTSVAAGKWLADTLVPDYADQIVCFTHNQQLLHLDTCLAMLPNNIALCARDSVQNVTVTDSAGEGLSLTIEEYFKSIGIDIIWTSQDRAVNEESTNLLFIEDGKYLAFNISAKLQHALEQQAGIQIDELAGVEIAKANGGVHCLTRPIY